MGDLFEWIALIAEDAFVLSRSMATIDASGARVEADVLLDCVDVTFSDDEDGRASQLEGVRYSLLY